MSGHFDSDGDLGINRSIFENSLDAILLTKPDGTILAANHAAEKMFDMTEEEIKAAGRDGILVQDENLKSALEERAQKGRVRAELTFKRKNGTTFPGEITSTIFKDRNGNDRTNMTIRDLSDLKLAEKKLVESEKRYHLVADFTYDWEEWIDNKKRLKYVSPSCERITGYNVQEFLANPNLLLSIVHTDDQKLYKNHLNVDFFNENAESIVFRIISHDNKIHWIEHICQPVYDDNGQFMGRRASNRDITERKKAEELLLKAKEQSELDRNRLESILETTPSAVIIVDASNSKISYINKRARQLYGIDITDLNLDYAISKVKAKRANGSEYPVGESPTGRALKGQEVYNEEVIMEQANGLVIPILASAAPIINSEGKIIAAVSIFDDITERQKAEDALRESEVKLKGERDLLQAIIDSIPVMITIYDPNELKFQINREFERILGWTNEEAQNIDLMAAIYPDPEYRQMITEYVLSLTPGFLEQKMVAKNGSIIDTTWANVSIPDGRQVGIGLDVRERKKAEKKIQSLYNELQTVLDNAPIVVWIAHDPDCKVITGNKYAEQMVMQVPEGGNISASAEEDAKAVSYKTFSNGVELKPEELPAQRAASTGKPVEKTELELVFPDGRIVQLLVGSMPLFDENGDVRGSVTAGADVTFLKETENALKESEERLRLAQSQGNVGVWDWNTVTDELSFTPELEKLYGLSPGTIITYQDWRQLTHPDDIEKIEAERDDKIAKHEPFDLEFRIFHKSGDIRWLSAKGGAIYNKEGDVVRVLGINIDITERKKADEALKRQAALLDVSYEAIFSWDYDGGILSWNRGAERLYGYSNEEAIDFGSSHELLKTEFSIGFNEFMENLANDKMWTGELIHTTKNGNKIIVESSMQLIQDTSGKMIVIETNRDITERKKTEIKLKGTLDNLEELVEERTKELLLANDYNRNLIETALDPLVTIGPDGKITDVNKATEFVTGYSREELVGTDFADYFTNPSEAEAGYQQVFEEGIVKDYPLEIKHKYGRITPVLYNASVYKDESGEVVGVFAAARDITERKKTEEAFRVYWESLEEQVEQRTEELAKSNEDLKQFAYVASHDLREPLRMISSFLQLLERRYKDQLDEDANEFIGFAVDGAKRLDNMIMDLLEYSRVANREMQFTDVNIKEVIDQVITNLIVLIEENSVTITFDSLPIIRGDENQMVILLQNLISNAIKYRSEETPQIHVSAEKDADKYVFGVKDNGIGIDPQHLERIFTIFKRLHTHEEYEGSGIGLAIAQRIVHQHGGEIWAESEPGKGSTFNFTIPEKNK